MMKPEEIRKVVEDYAGDSGWLLGDKGKELFEVFSEQEKDLTEEGLKEALEKCEFKNPDQIGLISLVCPIMCLDVTDRVMSGTAAKLYKVTIMFWYSLVILITLDHLIKWTIDEVLLFQGFCMIVTSYCFRGWTKYYNILELMFRVLRYEGKV